MFQITYQPTPHHLLYPGCPALRPPWPVGTADWPCSSSFCCDRQSCGAVTSTPHPLPPPLATARRTCIS